jgi:hypothetical protein
MNTEQFDVLLRDIADKIQRSGTIMRDAIPAREKLRNDCIMCPPTWRRKKIVIRDGTSLTE